MGNGVVKVSYEGHVALVLIDNPPVNSLTTEVIDGLDSAFAELDKKTDVRAVILTGGGEKAFVAGADIKDFPNWTSETAYDVLGRIHRIFSRIENYRAPVIAAINGYALGGGLELALACDIRLASEKAAVGQPEVGLGVIPGYGGTQRLCRTINVGEAKKMIFSGEHVGAQRAYEVGLVQQVTKPEALMDEAMALANKIASNAPIAVALAKKAVNCERNFSLEQGLAFEREAMASTFDTADQKEGVDAFLNKRKATFKNQ
jgi:enoyl-CoA hydratase